MLVSVFLDFLLPIHCYRLVAGADWDLVKIGFGASCELTFEDLLALRRGCMLVKQLKEVVATTPRDKWPCTSAPQRASQVSL
ncbi:hypothetical protein DITRI_Ditri03aG0100300 [Diplodiscus trichospermus]